MNCEKDIRKDVLLLAAGLLPEGRALALERHLASCPSCAALRLAVLEERAALKEAGAPLLSAGPAFSALPGRAPAPRFAVAFAAAAACFALFILLRPGPKAPPAEAPAAVMTPVPGGFFSVGEGAAPASSDFLFKLSGRQAAPAYIGTARS